MGLPFSFLAPTEHRCERLANHRRWHAQAGNDAQDNLTISAKG
jgi:hypothetical protein